MTRRLLKRYLPRPEHIRENRHLRWLGPRIHDPDLWHLNRRSVAGAVAVGAFFAFILPVAQFLAAAIAAVILRVNLPVAMTATLITNPFTFAPWYYLAYQIGSFFTGDDTQAPPPDAVVPQTGSLLDGFMQGFGNLLDMGLPLALGLAILAVSTAALGYLLVNMLWRLPAYLRMRRRMGRNGPSQRR